MNPSNQPSFISEPPVSEAFPKVWVLEQNGVRTLHIDSDIVQSSMLVDRPFELDQEYSRAMMAFLLFRPEPKRVLMIGLGGGSMVKFVHRHLPQTHTTVVEINPQIVKIAREHFFVPPDDERLQVLIEDGVAHVTASPEDSYDIILVDGGNGYGPIPELSSEEFFTACRTALNPDGVLITDLWTSRGGQQKYAMMGNLFSNFTFVLPSPPGRNLIAFALKCGPSPIEWNKVEERAHDLEARLGIEFVSFAERLRKSEMPVSTTLS